MIVHLLIGFAAGIAAGIAAGGGLRRLDRIRAARAVAEVEDRAALADHFRGCAEWEAALADHFRGCAEWVVAERDEVLRQSGVLRRIIAEQARWAHVLYPRQPRASQ